MLPDEVVVVVVDAAAAAVAVLDAEAVMLPDGKLVDRDEADEEAVVVVVGARAEAVGEGGVVVRFTVGC